jgi:hypothetical protein
MAALVALLINFVVSPMSVCGRMKEKLFSDILRVLAVSENERKKSALSSFLCISINSTLKGNVYEYSC